MKIQLPIVLKFRSIQVGKKKLTTFAPPLSLFNNGDIV